MSTEQRGIDARLNEAVRHICRNSAARVGEGFFSAISRDLVEVLGSDFAFVGELNQARDGIDTLAVWADGAAGENMSYALLGTPCAEVVGKEPCIFRDDVAARFPKDQLLVDMNVRGYVGIPVFDAEDRASGLVVALYNGPVKDEDFACSAMAVFSGRIGAEIDRLRTVRRAEELEVQALHAQKLESLGVLAGGLAHDFNNLLSSILGSADLARIEMSEENPALEHLETIREAGSTAAALCRQLLAYAGKGRFRIGSAHLSEVVHSQDRLLRASVNKKVTLHFALTDEAEAVAEVDRGQIGQILLNLVINASEAIAEAQGEGLVRVSTSLMACDADYLQTTYLDTQHRTGSYVCLEVSDDGPGMTAEVLEKLFDPFFTTKFAGRGLGLAAILGIVKSHNGTIKVYSEPGKGSSIKILLPASTSPVAKESPATPGPWRGAGKVMFVDDNDLVRSVGSRMLLALGFEPLLAQDGVAALELLDAHESEVVLVILDLTMPRMNGEETFRALRSRQFQAPVILTSGFNEQDTVQRFAGKGLAGFLQKPFQLEEFRERVREVLQKPDAG